MAIINVSPDTDITALIASAAVSEGDVLLLAQGTYYQSVIIRKNYVRILSEDCNAVFNGFDMLATAFSLIGVTGVEIYGVTIQNYLSTGISISGGTANRIIRNKISDSGRGITASTSTANLIWKNQIMGVADGVLLISSSTNNWVIENSAKSCSDDGFESFLSNDQNNAFIKNFARDCGGNCYEIFGINCLAYDNVAIEAANSGYLITAGSNSLAIENKGEKCNDGALVGSQNALIARNEFKNNSGSGLEIRSDFNIIFRNLIEFNLDSGLVIGAGSTDNFIYQNKVVCNTPLDIEADATDNNFLRNMTGCRHDCRD